MREILLYTGSFVIAGWGIAHLVPTGEIVKRLGGIPADNLRIVSAARITEGLVMCFLGVPVFLVTSLRYPGDPEAVIVDFSCAGMLVLLAGGLL